MYRLASFGQGSVITMKSQEFESSMERLEEIVEKLEKGDTTLKESMLLFEEGVALSDACLQQLESAQQKVNILLEKSGKVVEKEFSAE